MIVDPFLSPDAWTAAVIGGHRTPGVCRVTQGEREWGWDKQKGKGAAGTSIIFTHKPAAEFSIEFDLWVSEHFAAWDTLMPLLKYAPEKGQPLTALTIYHPSLAALDIASVVVRKISPILHVGDGLFRFKVDFLEYLPPPPVSAVAKPELAADGGLPDAPVQDPQIVALNSRLSELTTEAHAAFDE